MQESACTMDTNTRRTPSSRRHRRRVFKGEGERVLCTAPWPKHKGKVSSPPPPHANDEVFPRTRTPAFLSRPLSLHVHPWVSQQQVGISPTCSRGCPAFLTMGMETYFIARLALRCHASLLYQLLRPSPPPHPPPDPPAGAVMEAGGSLLRRMPLKSTR